MRICLKKQTNPRNTNLSPVILSFNLSLPFTVRFLSCPSGRGSGLNRILFYFLLLPSAYNNRNTSSNTAGGWESRTGFTRWTWRCQQKLHSFQKLWGGLVPACASSARLCLSSGQDPTSSVLPISASVSESPPDSLLEGLLCFSWVL